MNTSHQPTRYSVDAEAIKNFIEPNLVHLKRLLEEDAKYMTGWNKHRLKLAIDDMERAINQLNEDLLINKII